MTSIPWKKKFIPFLILGSLTIVITLVFQNCGNARFGQATDDTNSLNSLQNCTDPNCTQIINGNGSCSFNGQTISDGSSVTAYLNSSGTSCDSETRTCHNGVLSGSYAYASCTPQTPNSCLFNGQTIADGSSVTAYLASSPASGQSCQSETRTCHDGALSGSFQYASCTGSNPGSCLFNGQTIQSGSGTFAYQTSTVPSGQTCSFEFRLCSNGQLSGSYTFASCSPEAPASCMFNGQTIVSGSGTIAYQNSSVAVGQTCVPEARVCNNGVLSGSFNYASCTVGQPASCLFDGQTIPSGAAIIAYQSSSVGYGQACQVQARSCANGVLSGSYAFSSCNIESPASCQFNGQTVPHGESRVAFQASTVPTGDSCVQQIRTCNNGTMSGTYQYASCAPEAPASCKFNGRDVASGESVVAFKDATVEAGEECKAQSRKCTNGTLSGSYTNESCSAENLKSCTFNGQTIKSGAYVTAYTVGSVSYGKSCLTYQEKRVCVDGVLSGSGTFTTCTVGGPNSCKMGDGTVVPHGATVKGYASSTVAYGKICSAVNRTCNNGVLSGSGEYHTCTVGTPVSCTFNGKTIANGASVTAYTSNYAPYGKTCSSVQVTRTCNNGTLSNSSATYGSCSAKFVWVPSGYRSSTRTIGSESHGAGQQTIVTYTVPTQAQACAARGMQPAADQGEGICVSSESRAKGAVGVINYVNAYNQRWSYVTNGGFPDGAYCYKPGQKHDQDPINKGDGAGDVTEGYLCSH